MKESEEKGMRGRLAKCILTLGLIGAVTLSGIWVPGSEVKATPTSETSIMEEGTETVTADKVPTAKYAADTTTESNVITKDDIKIELTKLPELGGKVSDVENEYTLEYNKCKLTDCTWYRYKSDGLDATAMGSEDTFERYAKYYVQFNFTYDKGYSANDDSIPDEIKVPGGTRPVDSGSTVMTFPFRMISISITFSDWAPDYKNDKLYFYPNATGDSVDIKNQDGEPISPNEAMYFINGMKDITMSAVVKYGSTQPGNAYALFTLEGDNGKHFTIWHQPCEREEGDNTARMSYAFDNGMAGSLHKSSQYNTYFSPKRNAEKGYDEGIVNITDQLWHKVYFSLTSFTSDKENSGSGEVVYLNYGMDELSKFSKPNTDGQGTVHAELKNNAEDKSYLSHYDEYIFPSTNTDENTRISEYTGFKIGKKSEVAEYNLKEKDENGSFPIEMCDLLSSTSDGNNDSANSIKYVEISDKYYSNTAIFDEERLETIDAVITEFNSSYALQENANKEDYTEDSWNSFEKKSFYPTVECYLMGTYEWDVCDSIDGLKNATSKLKVCFHTYVDGECTKCQRRKTDTQFIVNVYENGVENPEKKIENCQYGAIRSVTAAPTNGGLKFSHWTNKEGGSPISYSLKYNFYVTQNMKLYAVYVSSEERISEEPAITISHAYAKVVDGRSRVYFEATRSVPSDYEVVEYGILYTTNESVAESDDFALNDPRNNDYEVKNPKVHKLKGEGNANNGVLTFTASVGTNVNKPVYVRGYVVYRLEITERFSITDCVYTDVVGKSFNDLFESSNTIN